MKGLNVIGEKQRNIYTHMCVFISSKHKENAEDVRDLWYYK